MGIETIYRIVEEGEKTHEEQIKQTWWPALGTTRLGGATRSSWSAWPTRTASPAAPESRAVSAGQYRSRSRSTLRDSEPEEQGQCREASAPACVAGAVSQRTLRPHLWDHPGAQSRDRIRRRISRGMSSRFWKRENRVGWTTCVHLQAAKISEEDSEVFFCAWSSKVHIRGALFLPPLCSRCPSTVARLLPVHAGARRS
jgi:hypothetical protein